MNTADNAYVAQEQKVRQLEEALKEAYADYDRANSEGDKSENSALDDAKNTIANLRSQLETANRKLKYLQTGKQQLCYHVRNLTDGKEMFVRLVDPQAGEEIYPPDGDNPGQASILSKLGRAMDGKHKGDLISYKDNLSREQHFEVLNVL